MGGLPTAVAAGARVANPASLTVVSQNPSILSTKQRGRSSLCSDLFLDMEMRRTGLVHPIRQGNETLVRRIAWMKCGTFDHSADGPARSRPVTNAGRPPEFS